MQAETQYARSGDAFIAYQVTGDGPVDLVWILGFASHLEHAWEYPPLARFIRRLSSFSRLIRLDKRGTGLSDPVSIRDLPTLEQRMDDVRAVMDAVGSERAILLGSSEGGQMSMLFGATFPERTIGLVLYASYGSSAKTPDNPYGHFPTDPEELERFIEDGLKDWGKPVDARGWAPSVAADRVYLEWSAAWERLGASPGAARALARMNSAVDVRHILPAIRVPTLVMHRTGDRNCPVGAGRELGQQIPGAKYVEFPGNDHSMYTGDSDPIIDEVEEFVTGVRPVVEPDRMLATILFTDIVGS